MFLTAKKAFNLPITPNFDNHANYIASLGEVVRWLAEQAENMGVEIYPGFAAAEVLYHEDGSVKGIATGNMGVGKDGEPTDSFQPGMELWAQQTLFAEGCRGSLSKQVIERFPTRPKTASRKLTAWASKRFGKCRLKNISPVWLYTARAGRSTAKPTAARLFITLTITKSPLVSWSVWIIKTLICRRLKSSNVSKPILKIRKTFEGGRRIAYGARSLIEGGLQSLPKLSFKGGVLIGDAAGFLNMPRIKGIHTAMKSAMLAAEAVFPLLETSKKWKASTAAKRRPIISNVLNKAGCIKSFTPRAMSVRHSMGRYLGSIYTGIDQMIFRGKAPVDFETSRQRQRAAQKSSRMQTD